MDTLRRKFIQGTVTEESYRYEAVKMTIEKLKLHQYYFIDTIGEGTFGNVIEVKTGEEPTTLAAKIVLRDNVLDSELILWPKLKHSNIVPLLEMIKFKEAHTYAFIMPKCRVVLQKVLEDIMFIANPKGLKILTFWLQNVVDGLGYLHRQDLCHLDVKCNNILISDTGSACICDFGFIQSSKEVLNRYRECKLMSSMGDRCYCLVRGFRYL